MQPHLSDEAMDSTPLDYNVFAPPPQHQHFATSDTRHELPPPNLTYESSLMPPPPLPSKVQHQRRRRSSERSSCAETPTTEMDSTLSSRTYPPSISPENGRPSSSPSHHSPRSPDCGPKHQSPEEFQSAVQTDASGTAVVQDSLFKDWMHGYYKSIPLSEITDEREDSPVSDTTESTATPEGPRRNSMGELLWWGSDVNFGSVRRHYAPAPTKETVETMQEFQAKTFECLKRVSGRGEHSNDWQKDPPLRLRTKPASTFDHRARHRMPIHLFGNHLADRTAAGGARAKRRRKNDDFKKIIDTAFGPPEPIDGSDEEGANRDEDKGKSGRKKRRESKGWQTRPVLTEAQRRENHIKSEKKRRILINEGYEDLCKLVPSLGKGKHCKSTILQLAGQFLDEVLEGNMMLEDQLYELERQGKA